MPKIDEQSLCFVNFNLLSFNATVSPDSISKTKLPSPSQKVPMLNTHSGQTKALEDPTVFPTRHDSCFLMQTLMIGSTECLVMFDPGSNVNLINGSLAEDENLFVLSRTPSSLKVAGGSQMSTEYGRYLLTLGSDDTGWHRLTCHGIPQVTVSFPRYDLKEVIEEVKGTDDP